MLVEQVKAIANSLGLIYKGGDDFWLNLTDYEPDDEKDFSERKKYVFLRPTTERGNVNPYGSIESSITECQIVLSVRSKISDESFDWKYDTHIKKLKPIAKSIVEGFSFCDGFTLKSYSLDMVTDAYDTNMDGYLIKMSVEFEE